MYLASGHTSGLGSLLEFQMAQCSLRLPSSRLPGFFRTFLRCVEHGQPGGQDEGEDGGFPRDPSQTKESQSHLAEDLGVDGRYPLMFSSLTGFSCFYIYS